MFFMYLPRLKKLLPVFALAAAAISFCLAFLLHSYVEHFLGAFLPSPYYDAVEVLLWTTLALGIQLALTIRYSGKPLHQIADKEQEMLDEYLHSNECYQDKHNKMLAYLSAQKELNRTTTGYLGEIVEKTERASNNIISRTRGIDGSIESLLSLLGDLRARYERLASESQSTLRDNNRAIDGLHSYIARRVAEMETDFKVVQNLNQSAQSMSGLVELIKAISDQTNLLALNASIEAARAGAHGRGFAVVADEVRKLSVQTDQAASKIGEAIDRMANDISTQFDSKLNKNVIKEESELLNELQGQLIALGKDYSELDGLNRAIVENVGQSSQDVAHKVLDLLANIQFQDMVRQRIELIGRALGDMDAYSDRLRHCQTKGIACKDGCEVPDLDVKEVFNYYINDIYSKYGAEGKTAGSARPSGAHNEDVTFF